jgi:hypothetical protein
MFGLADTALAATDKDLDPATTSQAMRALQPRDRRWRRTALVLSAGTLIVAAVVVLLGVPWLRRTTPASSWPGVQAAPAGSATAGQVPPPPTPRAPEQHATRSAPAGGSAAPAAAPDQPTTGVEPTGSDAGHASATPHVLDGVGNGVPDGASGRHADEPPPPGHTVARHPAAKPPDKKPPVRKPPVRKPAPGDPKDVLIVDPFSHGTSSPRSDSP